MRQHSPIEQPLDETTTNPNYSRLSNNEAGMLLQLAEAKIVACNPAAEKILGYTAAQLIGKTSCELPWHIHPDSSSCPPVEHPAILALKKGQPSSDIVMGIYRANGDLIWLQLNSNPLFGANSTQPYGVVTTFSEIPAPAETTLSHQKVNNRQLAEIEALYATAPIGLCFVDTDLRFIRINEQLAQINGLSASEHLGHTLREILPEMADQLEPLYRQVIQSGEPILDLEVNGTNRAQPGVQRVWLVSYHPFKPEGQVIGVNAMVQEITDRKRLEKRLSEANGRVTSILESMTDGFVALDQNWRITYMNSKAVQMTGLSPQAVLGKTHWEVWPWSVGKIVEQQYRQAMTEQVSVHFEVLYQPMTTWYEVHAYPTATGLGIFYQDINNRKQAEIALKDSEERFRQLVEHLPHVFWMSEPLAQRLIYASPAYEVIWGRPLADIYKNYQTWLDAIHEDDRDRVIAHFSQTIANGTYNIEYRVVRPDGSIRWIHDRCSPILHQTSDVLRVAGLAEDITERKQAEIALQQSETRYRCLAELIPQLVWTANPQGLLTDVNQRWLDYTGLTFAQIQTVGWEAIVHPDDLPLLGKQWTAAQATYSRYQAEGRIRSADGSYRWHLHQAIPQINEQQQIIKWYGTATDIETQKQLAADRDRILQLEQAARAQAERANQIKDQFLAVLSHELRSPLNPILGWTRLLQSHALNETRTKEALATIERNAKLQVQLIEDLLDISRIMQGKMSLNAAPVKLGFVICAAIETVRLAAEAKNLQIKTNISPNVGAVFGDASRLQQVVWNLVSNAVKFTPKTGQVTVELSQVGNEAEIRVQDTGKGINPEFVPYVFEYFRQEDGSTTRKFGGLGLGLAIARQIVEMHGGRIWADSPGENQGATFTFRLPLLKGATLEPENTTPEPTLLDASPLSGIQALIVDDDTDAREFLEFLLQANGATVTTATSASEALQILQQTLPDILLSDIGMPEMDGYLLMQRVRSYLPAKNLPAIALTAYAGETDQKQALAVGFQRHVAKPLNPDAVVSLIIELLQR